MKKHLVIVLALAIVLSVIIPFGSNSVSAQTNTTLINQLKAQVARLQNALLTLTSGRTAQPAAFNVAGVVEPGLTWTPRESMRYWTDVAMSADGRYQTAVASFLNDGFIHTSSDAGLTWMSRGTEARYWQAVAMSADGRYQTAAIDGGAIHISSDYGLTWTGVAGVSANWTDVAMSADGRYQTAVAASQRIFISSDYGASWTARDSVRFWRGVAMSADGRYQTAVVDSDKIFVSADYGVNWSPRSSNKQWEAVAISADGRYQTAVAAYNKIYLSGDYGANWTGVSSDRIWRDVAMSADGRYQTAVAFNDKIYTSTDYGASWTARDSDRFWKAVAMSVDGRYQTAVNTGGYIYTADIPEPPPTTPSITVLSPNGGETLQTGSGVLVKWEYSGLPTGARMLLTLKDSSGAANMIWGQFSVRNEEHILIPFVKTGLYKFKIQVFTPEGVVVVSDQSDNYFTIQSSPSDPFITITNPNGGEILVVGQPYNFTWNSSGGFGNGEDLADLGKDGEYIYPGLIDNNGDLFRFRFPFATSTNDGNERVEHLPNVLPGRYKLWLNGFINKGGASVAVSDVSDNYFTITITPPPTPPCTGSPCVAMVYPNGGETLIKGRPNTFRWFSNGVPIANPSPLDRFQLELGDVIFSAPMGSDSLTSNLNFASGFNFVVLPPGRYGAKIAYYRNEQLLASDTSNAPFAINNFYPITVTAPNGGEVWQLDRGHMLWWDPFDAGWRWDEATQQGSYHFDLEVNSPTSTTAYLEKFTNGNFTLVGKIPSYNPDHSGTHYFSGYLVEEYQKPILEVPQNPSYSPYWYYYPWPFLPPPGGDYYIRVVNKVTGAWDRSDQPLTLAPVDTIWADLKINGTDQNPIIVPKGGAFTDYLASWNSNTLDTLEKCSLYSFFSSRPWNRDIPWNDSEVAFNWAGDLSASGNKNVKVFPFESIQPGTRGYVSISCPTSMAGSGIEGGGYDYIYFYYDSFPAAAAAPAGAETVRVTSPNKRETIDWSKPYQISWIASDGVETVSIALYKNSAFFKWIARDLPAQIRNYRWMPSKTISANELGGNYQISLIGRSKNRADAGIIQDKSDQLFSLAAAPSPAPVVLTPTPTPPPAPTRVLTPRPVIEPLPVEATPIPVPVQPVPTPAPIPSPTLLVSTPPTNAIDARENQLATPTGAGWKSVDLTFSGPVSGLTYDLFSVAGSNPAGAPRARTIQINAQNPAQATLTLTRPIQPGERITINYKPTNSSICLGFLPGDVNQDSRFNATDIGLLRSWVGTTEGAAKPLYQTDINRDGVFDAADTTRLSEVRADPNAGLTLPACPSTSLGARQKQLAAALATLHSFLQILKTSLTADR